MKCFVFSACNVLMLARAMTPTSSNEDICSTNYYPFCPKTLLTSTTVGVSLVQAAPLRRQMLLAQLSEVNAEQRLHSERRENTTSQSAETQIVSMRSRAEPHSSPSLLESASLAAIKPSDLPQSVQSPGWAMFFVLAIMSVIVIGYCCATRPARAASDSAPQSSKTDSAEPAVGDSANSDVPRPESPMAQAPSLPGRQGELQCSRTRLLIDDTLWRLEQSLVDNMEESSLSVLAEQSPIRNIENWREIRCMLTEKPLSLLLNKATIADWSGLSDIDSRFHVEQLSVVTLSERLTSSATRQVQPKAKAKGKADLARGETVKFGKAESIHIEKAADKKTPKRLHAFIVKWADGSSWRSKVLASRDESTCSRWVATLIDYANIARWHESGDMWKLNSDLASEPSILADIQNWRKRIFRLQDCRVHGFCLAYASEQRNCEQKVMSIFTKPGGKDVQAKIIAHEPVHLTLQSEEVSKEVLDAEKQYLVAMGCLEDTACTKLPETLYPFQLKWVDDDNETNSSFVACESEIERAVWMEKIEGEMEELLQVDV